MKKELGAKNWICPMPVPKIGIYDESGIPDMMTADAFGCGEEPA